MDHIFPGGEGVTTRNAAELLSADMYFMGTSVAATADAVGYDTKFSSIKSAIQASSPLPFDNVLYIPKTGDSTAITIIAGGQFTLADGTIKSFTTDTDLDIDSDLTTDDTLAAKFYYIWSNGTDTKYSDDGAAAPSDVTNGVRLRGGVYVYNDSGYKIAPFTMDDSYYMYHLAAACAGSDVMEVCDATISTTWTDVGCSAFVPAGTKFVGVAYATGNNYKLAVRCNGTSGRIPCASGATLEGDMCYVPVDASAVFEVWREGSATTRITVIGFALPMRVR